jgi:beta-fructofuranosidase
MNDPNGFRQWGSIYHLFYQYNPYATTHNAIHWGHASSTDLVHWRHLPIALAPESGTPDADGCWSGCMVDDNGVPTIIYSGHHNGIQRPCLATSAAGLLSWQKYPGNPIIAAPPPELDLVGFRDHCVWHEDGSWRQVIGAGIRDVGGAALLYRSDDLRSWEYLHPLLVGDKRRYTPLWSGSMWECPDFFELDGRHVLIAAIWDEERLHYSAAFTGSYHAQRFTLRVEHKLDYGDNYFYAPQTLRDQQGRRIIIGWMQEGRSPAAQQAAGWAGVMSLPRVLSLGPEGHVRMQPIPELAALRGEAMHCDPITLKADQPVVLPDIVGNTLELDVALEPGAGGRCGLAVRRARDGSEETLIVYDAALRQLCVERSRSSLDTTTERTTHLAPLILEAGEPLRLRIFLDASVLEVFANERVSISSRIYPTRPDSITVALLAEATAARLISLDAWRLRSIWQA